MSSTGGRAPATVTPRFEKISQGLGLIRGRANSPFVGAAGVLSQGVPSFSSTGAKGRFGVEEEAASPIAFVPAVVTAGLTLLFRLAAAAAF